MGKASRQVIKEKKSEKKPKSKKRDLPVAAAVSSAPPGDPDT